MLKNTSQLKSKLERSLATGAPFDRVKSEDAEECASVIKVVAQESVGGPMYTRNVKKKVRTDAKAMRS